MRHALKIAYDGTNYFGFQVQKDRPTVQGVLLNAFRELGITKKFFYASRTDKGVSALGQTISFFSDSSLVEPKIINSVLPPDIKVIAHGNPPPEFNPRKVKRKWYRYVCLDENFDIERLEDAIEILTGTHDFRNFCKRECRNPVLTLEKIEFKKNDKVILFDFYAKRFLWTMIRRIVTVLRKVSLKIMSLEELELLLKEECVKKPEPSDPHCLILMETYYDNTKFKYDKEAIDFFKKYIEKKIFMHLSRHYTYETISEFIEGLMWQKG